MGHKAQMITNNNIVIELTSSIYSWLGVYLCNIDGCCFNINWQSQAQNYVDRVNAKKGEWFYAIQTTPTREGAYERKMSVGLFYHNINL